MLAGHFGVGLALKARYTTVPLVPIVLAAALPDLFFVLFHAIGWESLSAPPAHFFRPDTFDATPFSHDFSMVSIYAGLTAAFGLLLWSSRWALALGWAVASHILLDFLVHAPDIGVGGPWIPLRVGLDLWRRAPVAAWGLEAALVCVGGALYVRSCAAPRGWRAWAVPGVLLSVHTAALAVW
ncbi:MAG: hypothetical protein JSW67_05315 [Candidatus Latescibacterota bacterium]|nr:MAG: hypothetical protein JSW67_05315 [Candidatus Latescibacterota bacterium]